MEHIRYAAAACQTDLANPVDRPEMRRNTDRMLSMIDSAVAGSAPFLPVRLVVFPEFAHAAPVFPTVAELERTLAVPVPNEHTERLTDKARPTDQRKDTESFVAGVRPCLAAPPSCSQSYEENGRWIEAAKQAFVSARPSRPPVVIPD